MCLLTGLHAALRRRDVFADPSLRWADPRTKLLTARRGRRYAARSSPASVGGLATRLDDLPVTVAGCWSPTPATSTWSR
jgi:hypothetical protein